MSSKRRLRRRSCANKQTHQTETEAVAHAISLGRAHDTRGTRWRAYRCRFCGLWHVGRPPRR